MSRIGINGFGRVGRSVLRLAVEDSAYVVAINDPKLTVHYMVYLFKYDSTHGRFKGKVYADAEGYLVVNAQRIRVYSEENPEEIDWISAGAQYIVECSGVFTKAKDAARHLQAGAKRVFICGTCSGAPILVCGVNWDSFATDMTVISMACSTTNCLAPLASVVHTNFEIVEGFVTALHSVTAAHKTVDNGMGLSWRNCRGSLQNLIPGKSGAASAVGKIIPELEGKLSDMAFRVPTANVSVLDFTVRLGREATLEEITAKVQEAAEGPMKGIIGYTDDEVVSADFKSDIRSCIFDAKASVALNGQFVKLVAWFDNEYAYAKRLIDLIRHVQLTDFPQGFERAVESAVEVAKVESKTGRKGRVRAKVMHMDEEAPVVIEPEKPEVKSEEKSEAKPEEVITQTQKLDGKSEDRLEVKISKIQQERGEEPQEEKKPVEIVEEKSEIKIEENTEVKEEPKADEPAEAAPAE